MRLDSARLLAISILLLVPSGNLAKPRHVNEQRREYKYQSSTKVVGSTSGGQYSSSSGSYSSSNDLSPWAQSHLDEVNNMAERLRSEYNLQSHGGSQQASYYSSSSSSAAGQLGSHYSGGSTLNYGSFTGKTQEELDLLAKEMTEQMLTDMKTGKLVYTEISEPNYFQHQAAEKLEALSREQNMQVQQPIQIGGGYHKTTEKKHYEYSSTINGYQPRPTYATEVESLNQHEEHSKVMYPPTITIGGGSQIVQRKNCSGTIHSGNVVVGQSPIIGCSRVISSQQSSDASHSQQGATVPVYQGSYFQGSTSSQDHSLGATIVPSQQTSLYEYQKHQHETQNHSPTYVRPVTVSSSHQESSNSQSWKEQQARQHIPVAGSHTIITSSSTMHDHKHAPTVMPTTQTTSFEYQKHDHETQKRPTIYVLPATQESSSSQSWKEHQAQQHTPISGSHTVITSSTSMHDHKHTPTVMPTTQTTSFEYHKNEHETQKHIPSFSQSATVSSSHQESSDSQTWKEQQAHITSGGKHSIYEFLEKDKEHVPNYDSQVIMDEKTIETINAEVNRYKPHVTVVRGEHFREEGESHTTQTDSGQVQQNVLFPEFTFEEEHIEGDKTSQQVIPGSLIHQTTKEQHESNVQYRPNYPTSHTRQRNEEFNTTNQYTGGYQQTYPVHIGGKTEITDSTTTGNRTVYYRPGYGMTVTRNTTIHHSGEGGNTVLTQAGTSLTTSEMEARNASYYHRPATASQGNTEYYRESYYGSPHSISSSQANITREEGETHTHHTHYPHSVTGSETYENAEEYSSHRPGQPGYVISYNKTSENAHDIHHHTHSHPAGHGYASKHEEGHMSQDQHQGHHNQHHHGMHSSYEHNMNTSSGVGIGYLTYEERRILEESEERRRQYLIAMGLPLTTTIEEERQFNISIGIGGGVGGVYATGYNSSHSDLHGSNTRLNIYREGEHDNDEYRRGKDKTSASGKPPKQIVSKDRGDQPPQHIEEDYDDSEETVEVEPGLGPYPPNQGLLRRHSTTPMPHISGQYESGKHKSEHSKQETMEVWPATAGETEIQRTYRRKETTVTSTIPVVIGSTSTVSGQGSNSSTSYVNSSTRWPVSSGSAQQSSSNTYSYGDFTDNEKDMQVSAGTRTYRHESTSARYPSETSISSGSHYDRQATVHFGDDLTQKQENLGDENERYLQIGRNQKNSTYHYSGQRDSTRYPSAGGHTRITSGSAHGASTDDEEEERGQQTQDIRKELGLTQMQLDEHGSHGSDSSSYGSSGYSRSMGVDHTDAEQRRSITSGHQTEGIYNSQAVGRLSDTSSHSHTLIDDSEELEGQQTISAFGLDHGQQTEVLEGNAGRTHQGQHSMGTYSTTRTSGSGRDSTYGTGRSSGSHHREGSSSGGYTTGTSGTVYMSTGGLSYSTSHNNNNIRTSEELEGQKGTSEFGLDLGQQTEDMTQKAQTGSYGSNYQRENVGQDNVNFGSGRNQQGNYATSTGGYSSGSYSSTGSRSYGHREGSVGSGSASGTTGSVYASAGSSTSRMHSQMQNSEEIEGQQTISAFGLDHGQESKNMTGQSSTGNAGSIYARHGSGKVITVVVGPSHTHLDSGSTAGNSYGMSTHGQRESSTSGGYASGSYSSRGSHGYREGVSSDGHTASMTSHSTQKEIDGQQTISGFELNRGQSDDDASTTYLRHSTADGGVVTGTSGSEHGNQGRGSYSGSYSSRSSSTYNQRQGPNSGRNEDHMHDGYTAGMASHSHQKNQDSQEIDGQQTISAFGLESGQKSEDISSVGDGSVSYHRHSTASGGVLSGAPGSAHGNQGHGSHTGSYSSRSSSTYSQRQGSTSGGNEGHRHDGYTSDMTSHSHQKMQGSQEIDGQQTISVFGIDRGQNTEDITSVGSASSSHHRHSTAPGGVVVGTSGSAHGNQGHGSYSGSYSSSSSNSYRQGSAAGSSVGRHNMGESEELGGQHTISAFDHGQKSEDMTQQFIDLGQETEDIRQQLQSQQGGQQSYNYGSSRHSHGSYTGHSTHQGTSHSSEYDAQVEEVTTEVNTEENPGFWKRVGKKAKDIFG